MMARDILGVLSDVTSCRRCKCRSCEDGYENHDHTCTHGEWCVDAPRKLLVELSKARSACNYAAAEIAQLRRQVREMTAETVKGDGI